MIHRPLDETPVEDDQALSFLKRTLMVDASEAKMMVSEKYTHNLVKMMTPVKKSKTPGAGIEDGKTMEEDDWRRPMYIQVSSWNVAVHGR